MKYRIEVIEAHTHFVTVQAADKQLAVIAALAGAGQIVQPYPPELQAVSVSEIGGEDDKE